MSIESEMSILTRMATRDLQIRYAELFGEGTRVHNRTWLIKRIAWRIQAVAEGDQSERARQRAAELANDADLRLAAPMPKTSIGTAVRTIQQPRRRDSRLPEPGTILTRPYKGQDLQIKVLQTGFEFAGHVYASLSAVAKEITGSHCNGYLFFRLVQKGNDQ